MISAIIISLGFYIYAVIIRRFWAYLIGIPFQAISFTLIAVLFIVQPRVELFQSLYINNTDYHLVHQEPFGGSNIYLLRCEYDDCVTTHLKYLDSFKYFGGTMTYLSR